MTSSKAAKSAQASQSNAAYALKRILSFFDVIPVLRAYHRIPLSRRVFHTIVGLTIMMGFQILPYYGLHYLNKQTFITALVSKSKNMISLTKNALMVTPLVFTVLCRSFNVHFEQQSERESLFRGMRNLSIFVGLFFRYTYLFLFREINAIYILLYPEQRVVLVFFAYILQNLIASVCVIWLEEYLENYGFNTRFNFSYYQATQIILQVASAPYPNTLGLHTFFCILVITAVLTAQDMIYTERISIQHTMVSGVNRKIEFKPSNVVSNAIFAHKLLKTGVLNLLEVTMFPLQYVINTYTRYDSAKVYGFLNKLAKSPIFTENYIILMYLPNWKNTFAYLNILGATIDYLILLPLLVMISGKYSLQLDPRYLQKKIAENRFRVVNTRGKTAQEYIDERFHVLLSRSAIIGGVTQLIFGMIPIYGIVLNASTIVYFYGRVEGIVQTVKQSKDQDLPQVLLKFKSKI